MRRMEQDSRHPIDVSEGTRVIWGGGPRYALHASLVETTVIVDKNSNYLELDGDLADGSNDDAHVVDHDHHVPQIAEVQSIAQRQRATENHRKIVHGCLKQHRG